VSIKETLNQDMKAAMRSGDKLGLGAIRLAIAAIKKQEIEVREPLGDAAVLDVLGKLIKQGRDAQAQYESAGRDELAAKEAAEIAVFERYMPKALSAEDVETLIKETIAATGAASVRDMGRVMAAIRSQAAGRIDMGAVSGRVREILSANQD
jgi:uncharacterized protein YqeY